MSRHFLAIAATTLLLSACGGEQPAAPAESEAPAPVEPTAPAAAPDPTALTTPAQAGNPAAMNLLCGGAAFRVAFEDARAVVYNDDGTQTELALLPASANAEPGVSTFTDAKMTFAKSGGGDTPTIIRFARGRMALQDCSIAVN